MTMPEMTLEGTFVTICDWHGRVVWLSGRDLPAKPGDFAWQHLAADGQERARIAFARAVSLREESSLEFQNRAGQHFRAWLWPLCSPEIAVCVLAIVVPVELTLLTDRERDVLGLLSQGHATREIAKRLDISTSTVHTHLRRRGKSYRFRVSSR